MSDRKSRHDSLFELLEQSYKQTLLTLEDDRDQNKPARSKIHPVDTEQVQQHKKEDMACRINQQSPDQQQTHKSIIPSVLDAHIRQQTCTISTGPEATATKERSSFSNHDQHNPTTPTISATNDRCNRAIDADRTVHDTALPSFNPNDHDSHHASHHIQNIHDHESITTHTTKPHKKRETKNTASAFLSKYFTESFPEPEMPLPPISHYHHARILSTQPSSISLASVSISMLSTTSSVTSSIPITPSHADDMNQTPTITTNLVSSPIKTQSHDVHHVNDTASESITDILDNVLSDMAYEYNYSTNNLNQPDRNETVSSDSPQPTEPSFPVDAIPLESSSPTEPSHIMYRQLPRPVQATAPPSSSMYIGSNRSAPNLTQSPTLSETTSINIPDTISSTSMNAPYTNKTDHYDHWNMSSSDQAPSKPLHGTVAMDIPQHVFVQPQMHIMMSPPQHLLPMPSSYTFPTSTHPHMSENGPSTSSCSQVSPSTQKPPIDVTENRKSDTQDANSPHMNRSSMSSTSSSSSCLGSISRTRQHGNDKHNRRGCYSSSCRDGRPWYRFSIGCWIITGVIVSIITIMSVLLVIYFPKQPVITIASTSWPTQQLSVLSAAVSQFNDTGIGLDVFPLITAQVRITNPNRFQVPVLGVKVVSRLVIEPHIVDKMVLFRSGRDQQDDDDHDNEGPSKWYTGKRIDVNSSSESFSCTSFTDLPLSLFPYAIHGNASKIDDGTGNSQAYLAPTGSPQSVITIASMPLALQYTTLPDKSVSTDAGLAYLLYACGIITPQPHDVNNNFIPGGRFVPKSDTPNRPVISSKYRIQLQFPSQSSSSTMWHWWSRIAKTDTIVNEGVMKWKCPLSLESMLRDFFQNDF